MLGVCSVCGQGREGEGFPDGEERESAIDQGGHLLMAPNNEGWDPLMAMGAAMRPEDHL